MRAIATVSKIENSNRRAARRVIAISCEHEEKKKRNSRTKFFTFLTAQGGENIAMENSVGVSN